MTSPDGKNWTLRNTPMVSGAFWRTIAWCEAFGQFVAVGIDAVMTSADGVHWAIQNPPDFGSGICVAGNPTVAIIIGYDFNLGYVSYVSTDGQVWVPHPLLAQFYFDAVCWSQGPPQIFCAVSQSVFQSQNAPGQGFPWTLSNVGPNTANAVDYSPDLNLFCAVSRYGSISTSADGENWFGQAIPPDNSNEWQDVAWGGGSFIAVSGANSSMDAMRSPNGALWIAEPTPAGFWNAVCYAPELKIFCAVSIQQSGMDAMIRSQ
jgi:hypothetical protein